MQPISSNTVQHTEHAIDVAGHDDLMAGFGYLQNRVLGGESDQEHGRARPPEVGQRVSRRWRVGFAVRV
jgi:hypothetical protein